MQSVNVLKAPTNEDQLQAKINSLINAYKGARDSEGRTGRESSTFMYLEEMDEIFGDRPIIANQHTLNLYGLPVEPLKFEKKGYLADESNSDEEDDNTEEIGN